MGTNNDSKHKEEQRDNMVTHTPGPWTIKIIPNDQLAILEENNKGGRILAVCDNNDEQDLANARLIASAPDMYAVLKQIIDDYKNTDDPLLLQERMDANITDAEAAIAKAEWTA